jgi:hypothetical protein
LHLGRAPRQIGDILALAPAAPPLACPPPGLVSPRGLRRSHSKTPDWVLEITGTRSFLTPGFRRTQRPRPRPSTHSVDRASPSPRLPGPGQAGDDRRTPEPRLLKGLVSCTTWCFPLGQDSLTSGNSYRVIAQTTDNFAKVGYQSACSVRLRPHSDGYRKLIRLVDGKS